jgi:hypothetical protein
MPITLEQIAAIHPRLYHMAQAGSWPSIKAHGLLSTTALLDLYGVSGAERDILEGKLRKSPARLTDVVNGEAWIRDQRPMSERKLASCLLDGLTPTQWCRMLNERVFFWLTETRLKTLMKAYNGRPHLVIEVDTAELLSRHSREISLTPMNTGCTSPMAFPRGIASFLPPSEYPFMQNSRKKGGPQKAIVELTVLYSVPDIADLTIRATHREIRDGECLVLETVYERG